jgi:hypothetical protein
VTERLIVAKYVQKNQAISSEDADGVYDVLRKMLEDEQKVILDFDGISLLISSFLNSAIGRLYGEFKPDIVDNSVSFVNLDARDEYVLKMIIGRVKDYYSNKSLIEGIVNNA